MYCTCPRKTIFIEKKLDEVKLMESALGATEETKSLRNWLLGLLVKEMSTRERDRTCKRCRGTITGMRGDEMVG